MGMEILKRIREEAGLTRHQVGGAEWSVDTIQQYERTETECLQIHYIVRLKQVTGWTWERFGAMLEAGLSEGRTKKKERK